eukprot:Opistho-2@36906
MSQDRDRSYGRRDRCRANDSRQQRGNSTPTSDVSFDPNARVTGSVERLRESFGFISCHLSNNLFFHFNAFDGDARSIRPGDAVEFSVALDPSNNRLCAQDVVLLPPGTEVRRSSSTTSSTAANGQQSPVNGGPAAEATYRGVVEREPKRSDDAFGSASGKIEYTEVGGDERRAYASFSAREVEGDSFPRRGDIVEFGVDRRGGGSGGRRATWVRFVERARDERQLGVVSSVKDSYGFVERCDGSGEVFFHFSECLDVNPDDGIPFVRPGDEAEFSVTRRGGKLMAGSIRVVPPGTIPVDVPKADADAAPRTGAVQQTPRSARGDWPAVGLIYASDESGSFTLPFVADGTAEYVASIVTLKPGDPVEFRMASHPSCPRIRRAVGVAKSSQSARSSADGGRGSSAGRETGVVATVRDGFGFIKCCDRDARVFFHFSELADSLHEPRPGDEFEFSVIADKSDRLNAVRITVLPRNSVSFYNVSTEVISGKVEKPCESSRGRRGPKSTPAADPQPGTIRFALPDTTSSTIEFYEKDADGSVRTIETGDEVQFSIAEDKRTKSKRAVNVAITKRVSDQVEQGFISGLKDNFGFIETSDREREVFFHYSEFDGSVDELRVGDEVEYASSTRQGKPSAVKVRKLKKGTILSEEVGDVEYSGTVTVAPPSRPSEAANGNTGRIEYTAEAAPEAAPAATNGESGASDENANGDASADTPTPSVCEIAFASSGSRDKRGLKVGDSVRFYIAVHPQTGRRRAVDIKRIKPLHRALVERTKGQYGFIAFKGDEEGDGSLYFHQNDVEDGVELHSGDEVEFGVQVNPRTSKSAAVKVRRVKEAVREAAAPSVRPTTLFRRQAEDDAQGPRFGASRAPKMPDGTRGFDPKIRPSITGGVAAPPAEQQQQEQQQQQQTQQQSDSVATIKSVVDTNAPAAASRAPAPSTTTPAPAAPPAAVSTSTPPVDRKAGDAAVAGKVNAQQQQSQL